jgi:hypothetical protein
MILPCGCRMWRKGDTFYIRPCSETCEMYQYALSESKRRGNKIEVREEVT